MRVLCLNAGSSSLKAVGFNFEPGANEPSHSVSHAVEIDAHGPNGDAAYVTALAEVSAECDQVGFVPDVVAHRIVHGGPHVVDHVVLDDEVRAQLESAVSFAPLHLPRALAVVDASAAQYPDVVHIACLDTAFHRGLPPAARRLPIPREFDAEGVRRYGFHGLSYEYLVYRLGSTLGERAVLAHLGNGSSLAAVLNGVGVDTTMGFTPSGGLVMGTRTGDLDPGVIVYLLREHGLDASDIEQLVDHRAGLAGLAGGSGDVRDILAARANGDDAATLALDVYCTVAAKHIAALTVVLRGLDSIVFTGGIGENAWALRAQVSTHLPHLGVILDDAANQSNATVISRSDSPVTVRVEPTNEELMMARHAKHLADGR